MIGTNRRQYACFGQNAGVRLCSIGKLRLGAGSQQRAADCRNALFGDILGNQISFGAVNQNIIQMKLPTYADSRINIVRPMAVKMGFDLAL